MIHKVLTTKKEKRHFNMPLTKSHMIMCKDKDYVSASSEWNFVTCEECLKRLNSG